MCGKCIVLTFDEVEQVIRAIEMDGSFNFEPDYPAQPISAFPKSVAPLIIPDFDTDQDAHPIAPGSLHAKDLRWGYEFDWHNGPIFNTRIDSAAKLTWRDSMEHRRCVIPCREFFETSDSETTVSPQTGKTVKARYGFALPDSPVMLIGGIWQGDAFSMVTTEPNAAVKPIHKRMPMVLLPHEIPIWLSKDYLSLADRSHVPLVSRPENATPQKNDELRLF